MDKLHNTSFCEVLNLSLLSLVVSEMYTKMHARLQVKQIVVSDGALGKSLFLKGQVG